MISLFLTLTFAVVATLTFLTNVLSLFALLCCTRWANLDNDPSRIPILILLCADISLGILLFFPAKAFITSRGVFNEVGCDVYGAADLCLSLFQIATTTFIALDRYIITIQPSWRSWRSANNYKRAFVLITVVLVIWSALPIVGFGAYVTHSSALFCSLDWSLGDAKNWHNDMISSISQRYIAFLTITFLLFFLIPLCSSSALYYSIAEHIKKQRSNENRNEMFSKVVGCRWAPVHHISKICLGCLLVTAVPYLPYGLICLNPFNSDTSNLTVITIPAVSARLSALFAPFAFIWVNGELCCTSRSRRDKKRIIVKGRPSTYQALAAMADLPTMSYQILTPIAPRRKLPQVPDILTPSPR